MNPISQKPIMQVNVRKAPDWLFFGLLGLLALSICWIGAQHSYIVDLRASKVHTEYVEVVRHDTPPPKPCAVPANDNGRAALVDPRDHATLTYNPYNPSYKSDSEWLTDEGQPYIEKLGYRLCPRP